jgi:hypothetical protein
VIGGLTTPNNSALVVCAACAWDAIGAGAVPPTGTTPTFTERYDPGTGGVLYVSDGVLATAGATGDKTQLLPGNNGGTPPGSSPNAGGLVCIEADTGGGGRTTRNAHPSGLGMQHGMGMTLPNGGRYL